MRLFFLGDMVGKTGRTAVWEQLPGLISDFRLDFVIVNGENAAGGFGITEEIFRATPDAGADVVTTGNHVWDQREALAFAPREQRFLRPANFPKGTPGRGSGVYLAKNGARVLVSNVMAIAFSLGFSRPKTAEIPAYRHAGCGGFPRGSAAAHRLVPEAPPDAIRLRL